VFRGYGIAIGMGIDVDAICTTRTATTIIIIIIITAKNIDFRLDHCQTIDDAKINHTTTFPTYQTDIVASTIELSTTSTTIDGIDRIYHRTIVTTRIFISLLQY
jgi:uncharacterized membrane protein YhiD involved in acid resistance